MLLALTFSITRHQIFLIAFLVQTDSAHFGYTSKGIPLEDIIDPSVHLHRPVVFGDGKVPPHPRPGLPLTSRYFLRIHRLNPAVSKRLDLQASSFPSLRLFRSEGSDGTDTSSVCSAAFNAKISGVSISVSSIEKDCRQVQVPTSVILLATTGTKACPPEVDRHLKSSSVHNQTSIVVLLVTYLHCNVSHPSLFPKTSQPSFILWYQYHIHFVLRSTRNEVVLWTSLELPVDLDFIFLAGAIQESRRSWRVFRR